LNVSRKTVGLTVGAVLLFALLVTCGPAKEPAAVRTGPPPGIGPFAIDPGILPLPAPDRRVPAPAKRRVDAAAAPSGNQTSMTGDVFDAKRPTLAGLSLGMKRGDVARRLGSPAQEYDLPDGSETVRMCEYANVTVGYGPDDAVVYVEVSEPGTDSGLIGIQVGQSGKQAAGALGLAFTAETRVLAKAARGGTLKVDLDPSTQTVLSVKLIGPVS